MEQFEAIVRALRAQTVEFWVDLDLTMAQLKALFTLEYGGPSTIGQVAERLGIGLPTASHLVDRLVQGGYVMRAEDPSDRRRTVATTTPAGSELVSQLRYGGRDNLIAWLGQLNDREFAALSHGLAALSRIVAGDNECPVGDASLDRGRENNATLTRGASMGDRVRE